jgi:type IV secretory pathway VirB10-like protein
MNNGQLHDDSLLGAVHDRLSDLEVPYDGADWDAMRRSLDQLPRQNRFRFSLNSVLLVVGLLSLSALGVWLWQRPAGNTQAAVRKMPPTVQPVALKPQPMAKPTTAAPEAPTPTSVDLVALVAPPLRKQFRQQSDTNIGSLRFGDMIDPAKGFIKPTHELMDTLHVPLTTTDPLFIDPVSGKVNPNLLKKTDDTIRRAAIDSSRIEPPR